MEMRHKGEPTDGCREPVDSSFLDSAIAPPELQRESLPYAYDRAPRLFGINSVVSVLTRHTKTIPSSHGQGSLTAAVDFVVVRSLT